MIEQLFTLPEMMLYADQFLNRAEVASRDKPKGPEGEELGLKVAQCRNLLALLQEAFNDGRLNITDDIVQEQFRSLILILHWVAFYARNVLDYRTYRRLVLVQAGFTRLLIICARGTAPQ
jgi:hypothetical protein